MPAERAAIGRRRRRGGGVGGGGRRIYEHKAVSNVRTNGRNSLRATEREREREGEGSVEWASRVAAAAAACHCEAAAAMEWRRMWSVTIFVQGRPWIGQLQG